jgi:hypothetical protein
MSGEWAMKGATEQVVERYGLDSKDMLGSAERVLRQYRHGQFSQLHWQRKPNTVTSALR